MFEDNQNEELQAIIDTAIEEYPDLSDGVRSVVLEYGDAHMAVEPVASEHSTNVEIKAFELGCELMIKAQGNPDNVWYVTLGTAHEDLSVVYFAGNLDEISEKIESEIEHMIGNQD